ncbi:hypothetical protein [Ruegeria sp. Ofav3-42]|uniref:hypothetical protein n=1 Tax=Ruegeria sp. Ofav3-42 TaxID=2917759 RepID=UPI001EF5E737|nr:hypothetical protein [Ruegeria sp. Ofav3-42]MCG7522229.1 hypothetical protein [Ruegeria sp. Ofav3-42]
MAAAFTAIDLQLKSLDEIGGPLPRGMEAAILNFLAAHLDAPLGGGLDGVGYRSAQPCLGGMNFV